jgi:putative transposase
MLSGKLVEEADHEVVSQIEHVRKDPDTNYGYRRMCAALMILGYFINHKKVYRLMKENHMLAQRHKRKDKNFVQYRIVIPHEPLEVIEMDIKYVWIAGTRSHAYILTILDTFTRFVLHWQAGFWMKSGQIKQAWEQVITNHLQPADLLNRGIHVEIRNDNGPQFGAKLIREFFEKNHLNQVFTHPYTPQENGHVESFHSILSSALGSQAFWDLDQLLTRLTIFYEKYNNVRLHGSIANLTPALFRELWDKGMIERNVNEKTKRVKFKLKMPYQQLSGNVNLREVPCLNPAALDVLLDLQNEAIGPETLQQPSVQRSPSVVPC